MELLAETCLDFQSFSDRMNQFQVRIDRIESQISGRPEEINRLSSSDQGGLVHFQILKERLLRLEECIDARISLSSRVDEVETNCSRLASDTFGAVESMHMKIESLQSAIVQDLNQMDSKTSEKLKESILQISRIITKFVEIHKTGNYLDFSVLIYFF